MIETNQLIIDFVENNFIALSMLGVSLRGLANLTTHWQWDNKLVDIFQAMFRVIPNKQTTNNKNNAA